MPTFAKLFDQEERFIGRVPPYGISTNGNALPACASEAGAFKTDGVSCPEEFSTLESETAAVEANGPSSMKPIPPQFLAESNVALKLLPSEPVATFANH
jgi:hypothetical protein